MINGNRTKSERGRSPRDFYITPKELAKCAINDFIHDEQIDLQYRHYVMDAGCGTGVWGIEVDKIPHTRVIGIDIEPKISSGLNSSYQQVITGDYLKYNYSKLNGRYDWVVGNPPFSLAKEFIYHSLDLVRVGGYVYFLLRLSYLEGIQRRKHIFKELKRVYVSSRRPSFFSSDGIHHTTDTLAYAMFLWQKGWTGKTEIDWLDWEYSK